MIRVYIAHGGRVWHMIEEAEFAKCSDMFRAAHAFCGAHPWRWYPSGLPLSFVLGLERRRRGLCKECVKVYRRNGGAL